MAPQQTYKAKKAKAARKRCNASVKNKRKRVSVVVNRDDEIQQADVVCIGNRCTFAPGHPGNKLLFHVAQSQNHNFQRYKTNPKNLQSLYECVIQSMADKIDSRFVFVNQSATSWSIMSKSQALITVALAFSEIKEEKAAPKVAFRELSPDDNDMSSEDQDQKPKARPRSPPAALSLAPPHTGEVANHDYQIAPAEPSHESFSTRVSQSVTPLSSSNMLRDNTTRKRRASAPKKTMFDAYATDKPTALHLLLDVFDDEARWLESGVEGAETYENQHQHNSDGLLFNVEDRLDELMFDPF